MKYADKPCSNCMTEKKRMLFEIDKVSFVLTELVLYLDTHPTDTKTIEFFLYYKKKRHDLLIEYAEKFTPLTVDSISGKKTEEYWEWAMDSLPWRKECVQYVEL